MEKYQLEKTIWTEEDFPQMGWHDSKVWGFLAKEDDFQYYIDLDYIFQWVHPKDGEEYFKFWVSPVTMMFENAFNISINIGSHLGEIEVADFHMENKRKAKNGKTFIYDFVFECQEGQIKLTATNFKRYVRKYLELINSQHLEYHARGGISFGEHIVDRDVTS